MKDNEFGWVLMGCIISPKNQNRIANYYNGRIFSQSQLAEMFNCSSRTIKRIVSAAGIKDTYIMERLIKQVIVHIDSGMNKTDACDKVGISSKSLNNSGYYKKNILTNEQKQRAVRMRANGETYKQIGCEFGVTRSCISIALKKISNSK